MVVSNEFNKISIQNQKNCRKTYFHNVKNEVEKKSRMVFGHALN